MNVKKTIGSAILALTLVPAYVAAQDKEMKATVVTKGVLNSVRPARLTAW